MLELIKQPWPWYVAGFLIGLTVPTLLILGNKMFGISSSLRHICAACIPGKIPFFKYDWKRESWNLFFVGGMMIGGFIAANFLQDPEKVVIAPKTQQQLTELGVQDFTHLLPDDVFSWNALTGMNGFTDISNFSLSLRSLIFIVLGGFLVGFGTRYAGGCTSGHSIMGLSDLQWPSLVATCCFLAGGFLMTWFGLPLLLSL